MTATTAQPCSLFCCRAASFRRRGVFSQEHTPTVYISPSNALVVQQRRGQEGVNLVDPARSPRVPQLFAFDIESSHQLPGTRQLTGRVVAVQFQLTTIRLSRLFSPRGSWCVAFTQRIHSCGYPGPLSDACSLGNWRAVTLEWQRRSELSARLLRVESRNGVVIPYSRGRRLPYPLKAAL